MIDICAYNAADISDLLDGLGDFGCYIMISSSAVYPETLPQPFREEQTVGANMIWGAYGTDKISAEECLRSRVPEAYIIRPPYLYGKMNNLWREAFVFERAEQGLPFYLPNDGKMRLQLFDIEDLCKFINLLLKRRPSQRIFNVGNPETVSVKDWVTECYAVLGRTPRLIPIHESIDWRSYFPFYEYEYRLDVSLMSSLFADIKPIEAGLVQSYKWFAANRGELRRKPLSEFIAANFEHNSE